MNSTLVSRFVLSAYFDIGVYRYFLFLVVKLLYAAIVCSNVLLVLVIWSSRSLHEPMYLFLSSLFVNELYGSTGLFPFLLLQILSDVHSVSASCCFLQIFCIYTYAVVEFGNLAVMSYDRYLAICRPLQYRARMTPLRVALLVALVWFFPLLEVGVMVSLSAPLQLCGNTIHRVYCNNFSIVRLACADAALRHVFGVIYMFTVVAGVVVLILYTYARILRVCCSGPKALRQKAVSTCSPHLASLLNFSFGCFFEVVQNRFHLSRLPDLLHIVLSLYFITCQPLFTLVVYGLRTSKIRSACKRLLLSRK